MIENAGRSMAQLAFKYLKGKSDPKVVILVGVGFKGACGYCTARILHNRGIHVLVCSSRVYQVSNQVSVMREQYKAAGGKETQIGVLIYCPHKIIFLLLLLIY
jgi:NAD(P)H-hydrate repair Nnr-like enzyme with NAD(P)H-hydrate epimerase domain